MSMGLPEISRVTWPPCFVLCVFPGFGSGGKYRRVSVRANTQCFLDRLDWRLGDGTWVHVWPSDNPECLTPGGLNIWPSADVLTVPRRGQCLWSRLALGRRSRYINPHGFQSNDCSTYVCVYSWIKRFLNLNLKLWWPRMREATVLTCVSLIVRRHNCVLSLILLCHVISDWERGTTFLNHDEITGTRYLYFQRIMQGIHQVNGGFPSKRGAVMLSFEGFDFISLDKRLNRYSHDDVIKWKHFPRNWPLWPVTRSFDVIFDLRPNKRLNKQPWGW